ncbi:hypothetical protein BUQ74_09510 [Leptospira weilii serovar Heyan]|nr:hypothetical protein BUQ74_09510 [Leptospira weilii serovar Heyan]
MLKNSIIQINKTASNIHFNEARKLIFQKLEKRILQQIMKPFQKTFSGTPKETSFYLIVSDFIVFRNTVFNFRKLDRITFL